MLYIKNNSAKWILSDSNGKIIDQGTSDTIDMSRLQPGLYFVTQKNKRTEKIIKR